MIGRKRWREGVKSAFYLIRIKNPILKNADYKSALAAVILNIPMSMVAPLRQLTTGGVVYSIGH